MANATDNSLSVASPPVVVAEPLHYGQGIIDEQNSVDASLHSYFPCMSAHLFS